MFRAARCDDAAVAELAAELRLPRALCHLLHLRGHASAEAARHFLKPRLDDLHDPRLLAGAEQAVERIVHAVRQRERILVHGDYDVDGMCAAALYTRVLRSLGADVEPFVPHRMHDGYDLGHAGVRRAAEAGATVILTGDCGIVAHDAVEQARAQGIDVIITDHHTPGETLPAAIAVVNPNRADCAYPFKGLAGAGVAYKLCQLLIEALNGDADALRWHLDLVALATIADLAPLRGENRILAHYGLRVLRETRSAGLRALMARAGINADIPIGAGQVSHVLAPRLNAAGRMGAASRGVGLLLADAEDEAAALADEMEAENHTRQSVDRAMLDEAMSMLEECFDPESDYGIVLSAPGWHPGVIGIVASRVVERVHRPVILISEDPSTGRGRGSARSIPAFDLYNAVHACAPLLERYGGHRQAAGMDLPIDRIDQLRQMFNAHARAVLTPADLVAEVRVDLEIPLEEADAALCRMMRHCGPFGMGNPQPVFVARGVAAHHCKTVGGGQHLRMTLGQGAARLPAIGFRMAERLRAIDFGSTPIDVAFQLQQDEWNGRERLQARLVDVRIAE
ncbi:MAG TPA: single-stranded-DNA-specific exonuclease RecJ [Longimicrobiales bacterium]|nr:single-stranded-DNA-specific exonuclease RecJ [Longimicrobiales bacterium]